MLAVEDRLLPPNHDAFVASEPPTGRVIIIAPTRAACETIEIGLTLHIETFLERTYGDRVRELARSGQGFGIIAGTGTGKTLAVRPIAEEILKAPLKIGVVNREREATPELPDLNVIIVTTGIARRWFQDGDILPHDTLVIDEIHQTSAELELCLALGKRTGCRFVWLSATVDPKFYRNYLNSSDVLEVYAFDPKKAADVAVVNREPQQFIDGRFVRMLVNEKRGVGVFLPTRAGVEQAANEVAAYFPDLNVAYYHGGEPVRTIRPFLEDEGAEKPFLLTMTAAGQSALNVRGLDTVVIDDTRFANVIQNGRNVLTRLNLGNNEILQMAGRVHGRVEGGRVFILSNRGINFQTIRPEAPDFQLAGDSERVALTCADLGVRADELELPVPLDRVAYRKALAQLQERGIINEKGRLSKYGKAIEALPCDRVWAELIVNADPDLVPYLAVMSAIESLHRMTREERDIEALIIPGSDHLTSYNVYAEAFQKCGYVGQVYGLPRHIFEPQAMEAWAEERGVLIKAIEDAALAMACALRAVGIPLPQEMPLADRGILKRFSELLARKMPFDLVIDEGTADGQFVKISKSSVCWGRGAIAGNLRYFADRHGVPRASIDGTQIPLELLRKYAVKREPEIIYDADRKHTPLVIVRKVEYRDFVLESESQPLQQFPPALADPARLTLAMAVARGETRHEAAIQNRLAIEEIRTLFRKSGGLTTRLTTKDLAAHYQRQLEDQSVNSTAAFYKAKLTVRIDDFVTPEQREAVRRLPASVEIKERDVRIEYDVEEFYGRTAEEEPGVYGVARLILPERLARTLTKEELPKLDRPLRFAVSRGEKGSVLADDLEELQDKLEGPWRPDIAPQEEIRPERPRPKRQAHAGGFKRRGGPPRGKRR